jgi:glycosyltransferase involved in cell wall biosynthesis
MQTTNAAIEKLRVLTWHIHGTYLYYLTQTPCQWYVPVKPGRPAGYGGCGGSWPWGANVHEVPAEAVADLELDAVLFQSYQNFSEDQYQLLSPAQQQLPRLYLEHDPPRQHPTDTVHPATSDPTVEIVHVTHFNRMMCDNGSNPTHVIDHGVVVPPAVRYTGELDKGIVVINNIHKRGRRLGLDLFEQARQVIPLDIVGINAEEVGGIPSLGYEELHHLTARYRFLFNPIRYTSLGLAVCEAMTIGLPIVGMATTEMAVTVENGVTGFVHTDVDQVIRYAQRLLDEPELAQQIALNARLYAQQRFGIQRFANDWTALLLNICTQCEASEPAPAFEVTVMA